MRCSYRGESNASQVAIRVHLSLFLAIQQVVVILHGDEFGPPILLCDVLQCGKLIRPH